MYRLVHRSTLAVLGLLLAVATATAAQDKARQIDAMVKRYHDAGLFQGAVLVADHGKVIYRKAFGLANAEWNIPNTIDTRFRIGSITKQFTAMLILQLAEEGKLRLDGTIGDYLPEYPDVPGRRVTIHQLLTHSSGIPSYTGLPRFFEDRSRNPSEPAEFIKSFWNLPLEFAPGSEFRYNNSGFFLLGAIIERLTGKKYDQVLRERILDPLDLRDTGYDWTAPLLPRRAAAYTMGLDGLENAAYLDMSLPFSAGSLYSTAEDLWRWDQALAARKLLSPASYELYESPKIAAPPFGQYAYGWFLERVPRGPGRDSVTAIHHGGGINGFITMNFRIPQDGVAIITLDNSAQAAPVYRAIAQLLYGFPVEPVHPSIARALYPTIKRGGGAAGVLAYRTLKAKDSTGYDFSEPELNTLGYYLLRHGAPAEAVRFFALNAEQFPESANVYDSLGEALLATGDTAQAIINYRKSVTLNPGNTSGADVLRQIEKPR